MTTNLNLPETTGKSVVPAFGYRFKIISKQSNATLGTGIFRSNEVMTETEQVNFLHQYTNGVYSGKESLIDIHIFETNE